MLIHTEASALMSCVGMKYAPQEREPIVGKWYSGMSERGRGAVVQYQGYGEFTLGDGTVMDMTGYDYLEEH